MKSARLGRFGIQTSVVFAVALLACWTSSNASAQTPRKQEKQEFAAADLDFFEKRVRPILVARCFECHSSTSDKIQGGLLLDSRQGVLQGGDSGPAAVPGMAEASLLLKAIGYASEEIQMPPTGKLPDAEIEVLSAWIKRGIVFPPSTTAVNIRKTIDLIEGRKHWAFQPLIQQMLPASDQAREDFANWPKRRLDAFVLHSQLEHDMAPSPAAQRRALIRRAKFDLLGLPPEPEEIERFINDPDDLAFEKLIDRYLASPHYGERWGRYWLDLSRYCDVPEAWREEQAKAWLYRDWVVRAVNDDLPYDRFVVAQFAADLLPNAAPSDNAALGFLGLSPTYWKELKLDHLVIKQVVAEEWEERIEAIGATFLGLTVACARCHDHKFDPISMQDYYGLAGVLASIRLDEKPIIPGPEADVTQQARTRVKELEKEITKLSAKKPIPESNQQMVAELRQQVEQIRRATPHFEMPVAFGIVDASLHVVPDGPSRTKLEYKPGEAQDVAMHIRGNAAKPGTIIPRRFLAVLASDSARSWSEGSGRLQLADAMVTEAAPLAARVFVNRVWLHHFGRGLVTTPSNFGTQGDRPSHPELLDDLAWRFIEHGWSLKWLHREIMLSATYQQTSLVEQRQTAEVSTATNSQGVVDPDNVWLGRMPLRRLDVEAWRDSILAVTAELDVRLGGEPQDLTLAENKRRTIYGTVKRRELSDLLRLYDFPDPIAHTAHRTATTTPLQQLFVLNSPFARERSVALAKRVQSQACTDDPARIRWLYRTLFGRDASPDEVAAASDFIAAPSSSSNEWWIQYCHVLLGSNEMMFVE